MSSHYIKDVATLELDRENCIGCGMCITVCPHAVFAMEERKALIRDKDLCMECGACQRNCPVGVIKVRAGVGCAAGVINGILKGTEPSCDCNSSGSCC